MVRDALVACAGLLRRNGFACAVAMATFMSGAHAREDREKMMLECQVRAVISSFDACVVTLKDVQAGKQTEVLRRGTSTTNGETNEDPSPSSAHNSVTSDKLSLRIPILSD